MGFVLWRLFPPYVPSADGEVYRSPDDRYFVEIFHGQLDGGNALISDGWRLVSASAYHSVTLFSWSLDSRYVVLSSFQHYGDFDLKIFDTKEWSWHYVTFCDMFAGSGRGCDSEIPIATSGRYLLTRLGAMIDLTRDLPFGIQSETSTRIGIFPEKALWSPANTFLAVVGLAQDHHRGLYIGQEAGDDLQLVVPLDADFQVQEIKWTSDSAQVEIIGTINEKPMTSDFDMKDYPPEQP